MRVFVAGAAGLIGGRLIRHLLDSGNASVRAGSRSGRKWPEGVEGHELDYDRPETLEAACAGTDVVINLAAMPERECAANPLLALRANGGGTFLLASAAERAGVKRLVQVSTYKVYGSSPNGRITEETLPRPASHYAITHRLSEDYAGTQHANALVFRLANGFGPPMGHATGWDVMINEMCLQAVRNRTIAIRSSGLAWRNFIPLKDVVRALMAAASGLPAGTYNLGSAESLTLLEAARRIARACEETLGFTPRVTTGPETPGEGNAMLDFRIDKLLAAGFAPDTPFDDEAARLLESAAEAASVASA